MTSRLIPVPFHEDQVFVVEHEGELHVAVKPIVTNLGIDWRVQQRKLASDKERWGMVIMTIPSRRGAQSTVTIPLRKVAAYLSTIKAHKCKPETRPKLRQYQTECDQALWDYWTKGRAENPRTTQGHPPTTPPALPSLAAPCCAPKGAGRPFEEAERARIYELALKGHGPTCIARQIGRPESSIGHLLRRIKRHAEPCPCRAGGEPCR